MKTTPICAKPSKIICKEKSPDPEPMFEEKDFDLAEEEHCGQSGETPDKQYLTEDEVSAVSYKEYLASIKEVEDKRKADKLFKTTEANLINIYPNFKILSLEELVYLYGISQCVLGQYKERRQTDYIENIDLMTDQIDRVKNLFTEIQARIKIANDGLSLFKMRNV